MWTVDPTLTPDQVVTIEERRADQTAQQRFNALALAAFAAVALLVALQGVYALLAYAVEERRREIGVRIALGATTGGDVLRLVLRPGPAAGRARARRRARRSRSRSGARSQSLLFGVAPTDALTFVASRPARRDGARRLHAAGLARVPCRSHRRPRIGVSRCIAISRPWWRSTSGS